MAEFDLVSVMGPYLDRHLVFALLEFLSAKQLYNEVDLLQSKWDFLNKTNMVDFAIDIYKKLHSTDDIPESLKDRRDQVLSQLQELNRVCGPIVSLLEKDDIVKMIESSRDQKELINFLTETFKDFKMEMMEVLVKLAKFRYECGNYKHSASYLYFYLLMMPTSDKNYLNVLWGKLASEILLQNWDLALEDLTGLRDFIDNNNIFSSSLQLLQQRAWFVHWSLFVFFNHIKGKDVLIEIFLYRPNYLNAIQTMCPHILRYLAAAVIINRSRRSALKDLVKVIQQESYTYRDPITEFIEHLYVNFDFEGARQKLHECQSVVINDFFLTGCLEEFLENARLMIFETFCRIHQCISIEMLAEKLNMGVDEAECWIVNLIRNARLDAKIDLKLGHVVMGTQPLSPYQQLLEKVDTLSVRSEALEAVIERKLKNRNQDTRWPQEFN